MSALARLAAALLFVAAMPCAAEVLPHDPSWRVVLIRGWDSMFPMSLARERSLRDALADDAPRAVDFFPEEIDALSFPDLVEDDLVALLRRKYRGIRVDVVIASGLEPLQFATRHRDAIWPGAAIVFNGVFDGALDDWHRPPRTAGVLVAFDVARTVAVGRALAGGKASDLYVVAGASDVDRQFVNLAMPKLARLDPALNVHYITGLSRAATTARVSALAPTDMVLYLSMLRDSDGLLSGPGVPAMRQVAATSAVPVLSALQSQFGRGPVGGWAAHFDVHGRAAGLIARNILEGGDPEVVKIAVVPEADCELDWRALSRWDVPRRNIPGDCTLMFEPENALRTYLWQIAAGVAIIILQSALLSALLVQSRRRRAAEMRLHARTAELAEQSRISVIGALTANIAHEINQPMGAILSNTDAAQMMLEQGTLTPDKLREILGDIRSDNMRASEVIRSLRKIFARSQWRRTALEVNTEVADALRHVDYEAGERNVKIAAAYGRDLPAVLGDSMQLQQVVINLAVNALEAVTGLDGARREVRVETHARRDGAEIVVADEGPGLSAEDAARVFESPFTTKNESMGFGLAIARSIVEMHHGRVWFEPNVPRGAVFRVWLPAIGTET